MIFLLSLCVFALLFCFLPRLFCCFSSVFWGSVGAVGVSYSCVFCALVWGCVSLCVCVFCVLMVAGFCLVGRIWEFYYCLGVENGAAMLLIVLLFFVGCEVI